MSEHTWVLEHVACFTAGGLETVERERLEQHTAHCADCARALEEARAMDAALQDLFVAARPSATLEDRLIQRLRNAPWRRSNGWHRGLRLTGMAAAVVFI